MFDIKFLTIKEVLNIHDEMIATYGGRFGLLDRGLLESAIHQPQAGFSGNFLYKNILSK